MTYYGPSMFFRVLPGRHAEVVRAAARLLRQPIAIVGEEHLFDFSERGPLSNESFPALGEVILLDDREHVLTVDSKDHSVQISSKQDELVTELTASGLIARFT